MTPPSITMTDNDMSSVFAQSLTAVSHFRFQSAARTLWTPVHKRLVQTKATYLWVVYSRTNNQPITVKLTVQP